MTYPDFERRYVLAPRHGADAPETALMRAHAVGEHADEYEHFATMGCPQCYRDGGDPDYEVIVAIADDGSAIRGDARDYES